MAQQIRDEDQREAERRLLRICHVSENINQLMHALVVFFQGLTGCSAVGIRLHHGEDYPYYETQGFPEDFVRAESSLCTRDPKGDILRDSTGNPVLECMCGNVLHGRFDPAKPFFTTKGSFWSNNTTDLPAMTTAADRQARTRNRCNGEGYESVALIPLRIRETTFGLFQFNDRNAGRFSPERIRQLEDLADYATIALAKHLTDQELRESEEKYRLLVENAQEAIIIIQDDCLVLINPAAVRIIGYSAEQITRVPFVEFVHPEDREVVVNHYRRRLRGEAVSFMYSFRVVCRDQAVKWVEQNGSMIVWNGKPAALNFLTDITERKTVEEALRKSESDLQRALKITRLGAWEYDVAGDCFLFNDQFYTILHTTAEQEGGYGMSSARYAEKFVHPDDRALVGIETRKALNATDPDYANTLDHRIIRADGEIRTITVHIRLEKDGQGRTVKTYGANQDITERKQTEDALTSSLAEKEVLLREIHHRVKNNLAAIIGLLDLQRKSLDEPQGRMILTELAGRIRSMSLVHEKLYRSESLSKIDFQEYIQSLISHLRTSYGSPDIRCLINAQSVKMPLDLAVPCGMIINELITNALKYAFPQDGAGLAVSDNRILVSLTHDHDTFTLSVADNGVGLPSGFDWDITATLGLSLVRMLGGHQLGGHYEVDRTEGTCVTLSFSAQSGRNAHA